MGNGVTSLSGCCAGTTAGEISRRYDVALIHDGLGHSFCYVRPDFAGSPSPEPHRPDPVIKTTTFRTISGASVSANPSTALSTSSVSPVTVMADVSSPYSSAAFESSDSFASLPLQPMPRGATWQSDPVNPPGTGSGPIERRFLSGPIESGLFSGPIEKKETEKPKKTSSRTMTKKKNKLSSKPKSNKRFIVFKSIFMNLISNKISRSKKSVIEPISGSDSVNESESDQNPDNQTQSNFSNTNLSSHESTNTDEEEEEENIESALKGQNVQWAQGKAGEDRVHVVVSEENGWLFVGIYDGFNGPDAPDYLLSNLYTAVHNELKGLLWNDRFDSNGENLSSSGENGKTQMRESGKVEYDPDSGKENCPMKNGDTVACDARKQGGRRSVKKLQWRCEWEEHSSSNKSNGGESESNGCCYNQKGSDLVINHKDVLKALLQALGKTEESYLEITDQMVKENPELALMGSCVLVMLMKGEDVYVMNVGDSRTILAQRPCFGAGFGRKKRQELERIKEESSLDDQVTDRSETFFSGLPSSVPVQLTMEHSTRVEEEVERIKKEHPDDPSAVENDRVKGYLKVTRAFGAGFLKQRKWNDALLEMFRIEYVGKAPYITCSPSLCHHKLTSRDKFLILSSDGLYEYFSNEEVIFAVESFIAAFPEGDPAQHLIEEVLLRAAKKFGMDFHELLEIPQGDRRRYHDDVSVIVISLEGRIWRSSM
ncbi:PREDICTED: probable protein phosphatase 2C 66 [Tarenaya hassleriana]|uniref:probable protein phosphatase 2C 66 n=1 Tax=Tarenaya hassleriana TaxID=28532 RepID=UPI00053C1424|nr:PREDICTED: probable protein phosphatase 2C 66 [Tarenaya hassleriana]